MDFFCPFQVRANIFAIYREYIVYRFQDMEISKLKLSLLNDNFSMQRSCKGMLMLEGFETIAEMLQYQQSLSLSKRMLPDEFSRIVLGLQINEIASAMRY